jgi:indolepyruvate ferredoxin oxidoreductase
MLTGFKLLASMKSLRGTPFDVFGYSQERRKERQLITDYENMIDDLLGKLSSDNHRFAVALARLPDEIRGYGPVKETAMAKAETSKTQLLEQFEKLALKVNNEAAMEAAE